MSWSWYKIVGHIDGYWQILTGVDRYCWCSKSDALAFTSSLHSVIHFDMGGFSLVLSWYVFCLAGRCLQELSNVLPLETVKLPFGVSSRACLWKVQSTPATESTSILGRTRTSLQKCASLASEFGPSRLACHGACKKWVLVHLFTTKSPSVGLHCLSLRPFDCCLLWDVVCTDWLACHDFEDLSLFIPCQATFLCIVALCRQGWQQSLIHFLKLCARRRSLKCVAWCALGVLAVMVSGLGSSGIFSVDWGSGC